MLLQPAAGLIVFGGTFAALLLSFRVSALRRSFRVASAGFRLPESATHVIVTLTHCAARARRHGTMALEQDLPAIEDPFLARGLGLVVDGLTAPQVRQTLEIEHRARSQSDEELAQVFESAAGYAPTLGILGAVLGLIQVMENLGAPSQLGAGIAQAFVATVYGVGSANLVFVPLATRTRALADAAERRRELMMEGIAALQEALPPRMVEQRLVGFLRRTNDGLVEARDAA
jgi:chemotaxis protein MotA